MSHEIPDDFAFGEQSERVGVTDGHDAEAFVVTFAARYGFNQATALSAISDVSEEFLPHVGGKSSDLAVLMRLFKRGLRIVSGGRTHRIRCDLLDYFKLALGWYDELDGVDTCAALARRNHVTKANASKYETLFRDVLPAGMAKLPPKAGQRSEASRETFTRVRNERLTK